MVIQKGIFKFLSEFQQEGVGLSQNENEDGHLGDSSTQVAEGSTGQQKQQMEHRPGKSDVNRTLATEQENVQRRLKTVDTNNPDVPQQVNDFE